MGEDMKKLISFKKLTLLLFTLFGLIIINNIRVNASYGNIDSWDIPIEWNYINVAGKTSGSYIPKKYNIDNNLTSNIKKYCKPNIEYRALVYEGGLSTLIRTKFIKSDVF